jgi:hypothetical protein
MFDINMFISPTVYKFLINIKLRSTLAKVYPTSAGQTAIKRNT